MFYVRVLGAGSAMPLHGRHHSSQWLHCRGANFLIDCGEATQNQLLHFGLKIHKIEAIFLSHLHADHVLGLAGLLTTLHMQGHQKPLYLWGPKGLRSFIEQQLQATFAALRYPLFIGEILLSREKVQLWDTPHVEVWAFPLRHGVPTIGYLFQEKPRPPRLDTERAAALQLSEAEIAHLRLGGAVEREGRLYTWESLTLPPPSLRSYAYCSDTAYDPRVPDFVSGVTVLYHEATFLSAQQERARQTLHSTAVEAARIAVQAQVRRLYLGHFSARYTRLTPFLDEARALFPETYLVQEGETYPIE
ncbi:MAG: ribonuclease Z [Bacteroidia bacterium]|nr:ribonuclease Z [Bacteroidia bacterium]GIV23819.1 MAG: ribonuclease Z [Bacteroidia bacterium]